MAVDFLSILLHSQKHRIKERRFRIPQPHIFQIQSHPFFCLLSGKRHHVDFPFADKISRKIHFRFLSAILAQRILHCRSYRVDPGTHRNLRVACFPARHTKGEPKASPPGSGSISVCSGRFLSAFMTLSGCCRFAFLRLRILFHRAWRNPFHRFRQHLYGPGMNKEAVSQPDFHLPVQAAARIPAGIGLAAARADFQMILLQKPRGQFHAERRVAVGIFPDAFRVQHHLTVHVRAVHIKEDVFLPPFLRKRKLLPVISDSSLKIAGISRTDGLWTARGVHNEIIRQIHFHFVQRRRSGNGSEAFSCPVVEK